MEQIILARPTRDRSGYIHGIGEAATVIGRTKQSNFHDRVLVQVRFQNGMVGGIWQEEIKNQQTDS